MHVQYNDQNSLQWFLLLLYSCDLYSHWHSSINISYSRILLYNELFTHMVFREQSLLSVLPFLDDRVISVKYGWVHVQEALVQKYIHAEIYSLSLLGSFAQLNGWGCHGDLSFAFFSPPLSLSSSGFPGQVMNSWTLCRFPWRMGCNSLVCHLLACLLACLLFTAMKQTDSECDSVYLFFKFDCFYIISKVSTGTP